MPDHAHPSSRTTTKSTSLSAEDQALLHVNPSGVRWVRSTFAKLFALTGLAGAALAGSVYLYASRVEPRWTEFTTLRIKVRNLPRAFEGYRVVQMADIHLAENRLLTPDRLSKLIQHVNRLEPDVVLITGDFVSAIDPVSRDGVSRLSALRSPDGVYGTWGNHDYWNGVGTVEDLVEKAGVYPLVNEHVVIRRRGDALVVAGTDCSWEGAPDLQAALHGIPHDSPVILMAHESNFAEIAARDGRVSLVLSGHSHGGQVRIPGIGPLVLPNQAWKYPMGYYLIGNTQLYVNRGLGVADIPLRLFCRPEITTFILTAG